MVQKYYRKENGMAKKWLALNVVPTNNAPEIIQRIVLVI
jgi:hypothetical protein